MKALIGNSSAKLASRIIDKWSRVTANGSIVPPGDVMSYRIVRESEWQGSESQIVLDNTGGVYDDLKRGHVLQIDEGFVYDGGVQEFGGFYGIIATVEQEQRAGETLAITAFDLVSRMAELSVDQHYEPTKTSVEREVPTSNPIPGNTNFSDVFDLANDALARTPPPIVYLTHFESQQTIIQSGGYEVDYQYGQLIFGNPINTYVHGISIDYYYYADDGFYVEDAIRDIIIEEDGYGNSPFTEADNLRESFSTIEGKTIDTMTPNLIAETIDGVEYDSGRVWYTSFSNVVTTLVSGDFTVPGANISLISQRYGRVILDAAISVTATVTYNQDYVFRTIQATGVQFPVFHATTHLFKNRLAAIRKLCSILAPNYRVFTKAISPQKIWAEYQSQKVTADFALNSNLMTRLVYSPDPIAVTRTVRYGQGINMTNRCHSTDAHIEAFDATTLDLRKWVYQKWSDGSAQVAALDDSAIQVTAGNVLASIASVPTGGAMRIRLRLDNPADVWIGFFDALTGAVPIGAFLQYCHPTLAPSVVGVTRIGEIAAYDNSVAVNEKDRYRDSTGSPVNIAYTEAWDGNTLEIRLIWDVNRSAWGFYRDSSALPFWYFDQEFIGSTAQLGIYVAQGTAHVDLVEVTGVNAAGSGVYDHFYDAGYTGYAVNHELIYIGLTNDGRFKFASGLGEIGDILADPIPRVTVDGVGLEVEALQINNADVTYRKLAHQDAERFLGITVNWFTDRYDYEIYLAHTNLSPNHDIVVYDPGGVELFTASAGSSLVDYGRGIVRHRRPASGGNPHITPSTATYTVTRSDLFEVDYNDRVFYISPQAFTFSYDHVTTYELQYWHRVTAVTADRATAFELWNKILASPDHVVQYAVYSGDVPEQTREGWDMPSIVRATFKYREFVENYAGIGSMLDGNWDTQFQTAFKENIVPGSILTVIDLGDDYVIDTIDIMAGFYKMGALNEIQVPYTAHLTLETKSAAGEWDVPAPEMKGFEINGGDTKSFERDLLLDGLTVRYIRVKMESLEHVAAGDPPGIWPIAIVELAAYSNAVIKGQATLVNTEGEADATHLYDEDGILSAAGDIVDSEANLEDFWGTLTDLNRRCLGILKEHYKNHRKAEIQIPFAPHIQRGVTIELNDPAHGISQSNWYVERETNTNGTKAIALARYP